MLGLGAASLFRLRTSPQYSGRKLIFKYQLELYMLVGLGILTTLS